MQIPVPDAFDETDSLDTLEVKLTPKQIEWLKRKAKKRNLSLDHVLRSIITAQIRTDSTDVSHPPEPGDGVSPDAAASAPTVETANGDDDARADSSIVDSLRSASERLQALTDPSDKEEPSDSDASLSQLQSESNSSSATENPSDTDDDVVPGDGGRSMFDLMDE